MSRIMVAWELGGNYGHLARQLPVAQELRAQGHEVLFVAKDVRIAATMLGRPGFEFIQAPVVQPRAKLRRAPSNYAELLLAEDYADGVSLQARVNAWQTLFRLHRPDVVIADHAPTTLIAAHADCIPIVQFGNGFEVPPNLCPMPSILPWQKLDAGELQRAEERVTGIINDSLRRCGSARMLTHLGALFDTQARIVATFAELDHYEQRRGGDYSGPTFVDVGGVSCQWRQEHTRRIFAYLHDGLPGLRALIEVLGKIQADVVCVITGIGRATARKHSTKSLRIFNQPLDLASLLPSADLTICQANMGTVSRSLLARIPLVLVPGTVEQHMFARSVERVGAGRSVGSDRSVEVFTRIIADVLGTEDYRRAAARLSDKYAGYESQGAARHVSNAVSRILGSAPPESSHVPVRQGI